MTNQKKTDYICISKESEGPAPDTLDETLPSRPPSSTVDGFRHERDKKEEAGYVPLPEFYTFKSRDERERILYKNFVQVGEDVKEMKQEIQKYKVKSFL